MGGQADLSYLPIRPKMGKNKAKKQSRDAVFKVATGSNVSKSKSKAKQVTTQLKKSIVSTKTKTALADSKFDQIKDSLVQQAADSKVEKKYPAAPVDTRPSANVNEAEELFSQL